MNMIDYAKTMFQDCIETMKLKNRDYSSGEHPFGNFDAVRQYGVSPVTGFIARMSDKIERTNTWLEYGSLKVRDESIKDTLADLANYAMLLDGYTSSVHTREGLVRHAEAFYAEALNKLNDWILKKEFRPKAMVLDEIKQSLAHVTHKSLIAIALHSMTLSYNAK